MIENQSNFFSSEIPNFLHKSTRWSLPLIYIFYFSPLLFCISSFSIFFYFFFLNPFHFFLIRSFFFSLPIFLPLYLLVFLFCFYFSFSGFVQLHQLILVDLPSICIDTTYVGTSLTFYMAILQL